MPVPNLRANPDRQPNHAFLGERLAVPIIDRLRTGTIRILPNEKEIVRAGMLAEDVAIARFGHPSSSENYAQLVELLQKPEVDFPEANEARVSLGSRVTVAGLKDGNERILDIVSFAFLHDPKPAIHIAPLGMYITEQLLGARPGDVLTLGCDAHTQAMEVVDVDQVAEVDRRAELAQAA